MRLLDRVRWRVGFLRHARGLPLGDRLRHCLPARWSPELSTLLMRRLRRAPDGAEYFEMAGTRIFFRPSSPIGGDALLLRGTQLILQEAFVEPCAFFHGPVRLRAGDVVLDLGGHIGTSALRFSRHVGPEGQVHSFEPVFHEVLARNVRENGATNVTVVPAAAGDRSGSVEIEISDAGIDASIARSPGWLGGTVTRRTVPLVSVDDYVADCGLDRVDFVKLDVEGAEELALRGARRVLERFRPRLSVASYHHDHTGELQHEKLHRLLVSWGYRVAEAGRRHIYAW